MAVEAGVLLVAFAVAGTWCVACSSTPDSSDPVSSTGVSTTAVAETTTPAAPPAAPPVAPPAATARIVLVGDVMLGRKVGQVVANDPASVFEGLRPVLAGADLALGNLESPLTDRAHLVGPNVLEADPHAAALLAGAGFAGMGIANNHAGDAGPLTVPDTIAALAANGLPAIGGGGDLAEAAARRIFVRNGVRVAVLAFDLTGGGPPAGDGPGVARWDEAVARSSVEAARAAADIVIVGVHGGVEYLPRPDPVLRAVVADLTSWGVDVVWGTGAHVPYPVTVATDPRGKPSVQAPGLGNALFDQRIPGTETGTVLELLVDTNGVLASRTGNVSTMLRSSFAGWEPPGGDAVALDGEWWSPAAPLPSAPDADDSSVVPGLPAEASLVASSRGDIDGDGNPDTVASYRRPAKPRLLHEAFPDVDFVDAAGRTAHLGVFRDDGSLMWGAGTLLQPVAALTACDGAVALAFSGLDAPTITAGGAWRWRDFGFATAPVLAGPAIPGCVDLDGDGHTEPVLVRPTTSPTGDP